MVVTFVVDDDPKICAKELDNARLGKQRLEAKQIIDNLETVSTKGFSKHPATLMWEGYTPALKYYFNCIVDEWISRGMKNEMKKYALDGKEEDIIFPWWFKNKQVQLSHVYSLYRKTWRNGKDKGDSGKGDGKGMRDYYSGLLKKVKKYYKENQKLYSKIYNDLKNKDYFLELGYIWPSKLTDEQAQKMKKGKYVPFREICAGLGEGVPSHFFFSYKDCKKWAMSDESKGVNPKTGKSIKETGGVYKKLEKAWKWYKEWDG